MVMVLRGTRRGTRRQCPPPLTCRRDGTHALVLSVGWTGKAVAALKGIDWGRQRVGLVVLPRLFIEGDHAQTVPTRDARLNICIWLGV